MKRSLFNLLLTTVLLVSSLFAWIPSVRANPPAPDDQVTPSTPVDTQGRSQPAASSKGIDEPNPLDYRRNQERMRWLQSGKGDLADTLSLTGTDRVLVVMVEFAGTDVFTWTAGESDWDPLGVADPNESTGILGDCSKIITQTRTFTYTGPLHNQIPRPVSTQDRSGNSIWTEDFSPEWFRNFMFGNGVVISYTMQSGTPVYENFLGKSVRDYYRDLSNGQYLINGDVIGWLQLPHSTWWYDADQCPGARSVSDHRGLIRGAIPGAGNPDTLVRDALKAVDAISNTIPGFDWHNYDANDDGIIDRLWIVHSGYGEEDSTTLLNRTNYSEAAVWSHSGRVSPAFEISPGISVDSYIMMPENGGIGVFAHEYGHNLGAGDLYSYGSGETSAGFWTIMADDWVGYPVGFQPSAMDPRHLDEWGWLDPFVITDTRRVYTVTLGQPTRFPGGAGVYRGARIKLDSGFYPLIDHFTTDQDFYWWGGKKEEGNGMMTSRSAIAIPTSATTPTLSFDLAYQTESEWDFLWVQVSDDGGGTWDTLTNTNTLCVHDPGWIGDLYGMDGKCGFSGNNPNFPAPNRESFDLTPYRGKEILLRFWYMTDWGTTYLGTFMDNVMVVTNEGTLLSDNADSNAPLWNYSSPWIRSNGTAPFDHDYYLQWRNVNANGGYDSSLGEPRWAFGPANTGLLVWYHNTQYSDNEIADYITDYPGFGPKGRMLVVDSHPEPYRNPDMVAAGYDNEGGNIHSAASMRDAPFTLKPTVNFTMSNSYPYTTTRFTNAYGGRLAVSVFNDALNYYPGAEYVNRGPGYVPPSLKWLTRQWDDGVILPSRAFYGINAPGYVGRGDAQEEFRYNCASTAQGRLGCNWFGAGTGLGYDGGTGNPGDVNGQYGWRVELLSEAADHTTATVRISNVQPYVFTSMPRTIMQLGSNEVAYRLELNNAGTLSQTRSLSLFVDPKLVNVSVDPRFEGVNPYYWSGTLPPGTGSVLTLTAQYVITQPTQATLTTTVLYNDSINPVIELDMTTRVSVYPPLYLPLVMKNAMRIR